MEKQEFENRALALLEKLYPNRSSEVLPGLIRRLDEADSLLPMGLSSQNSCQRKSDPDHEAILITYGDSLSQAGEPGLVTLRHFLSTYVGDRISTVHILPFFPYSSDDGFAVIDYRQVDKKLGTWADIAGLSTSYDLMFDAVINHVSSKSLWFQRFLKNIPPEADYFITADPNDDYSQVIRPRALPLLTPVETTQGEKYVWTTFSPDQIDLNYHNPDLLTEILSLLVSYTKSGAYLIRLDAIAYVWKKIGTRCLSLPETHALVKLIRLCLDAYTPGTRIITETNVPHPENISYFGDGDEANLVYQFALPPLTLFSFRSGNATKLMHWLQSLEEPPAGCAYFNFLSSHDGIGLMPVDGILNGDEREFLQKAVISSGGQISYKDQGDGTLTAYELNVNYQDALAALDESNSIRVERFLSAMTFLFSLKGVPGIYIHSLLGSHNNYTDAGSSGIPRRINRGSISYSQLKYDFSTHGERYQIFSELVRRLEIRSVHPALGVMAAQFPIDLDPRIISFYRTATIGERILVLINVSDEPANLMLDFQGFDLISGNPVAQNLIIPPRRSMWILSSPLGESQKGGV